MDAHAKQSSARKRLPELRAADFVPPYIELSGIQVAVDDLANSRADAKGKKAQKFVNEDILRELNKQVFFKSLQKK